MSLPIRALALGAVLVLAAFAVQRGALPAAAVSGAAPARQSTPAHTITVTGHGQVDLAPDEATISVGVQTQGDTAAAALSDNSSRVNAVVAAIEGLGIPASSIQTSGLNLYHDDQKNAFVAAHTLTVTVDSVTRAGAILDAAVAAGANNSWGVSFGLKNSASAQQQAIKAAVANARANADAMATSLGVSITGVISATSGSSSAPPPVMYAPQAASSATNIQPGTVSETADVTVTYAIG